jgi:hypothetical protein
MAGSAWGIGLGLLLPARVAGRPGFAGDGSAARVAGAIWAISRGGARLAGGHEGRSSGVVRAMILPTKGARACQRESRRLAGWSWRLVRGVRQWEWIATTYIPMPVSRYHRIRRKETSPDPCHARSAHSGSFRQSLRMQLLVPQGASSRMTSGSQLSSAASLQAGAGDPSGRSPAHTWPAGRLRACWGVPAVCGQCADRSSSAGSKQQAAVMHVAAAGEQQATCCWVGWG